MPKLQLGALLGGAIIAGVLPLQAGTAPLAADGPIQQNYIASEMQKLTQRLDLTPKQAETLRAAMEVVVHDTAKKTVDQTLKEILTAKQWVAWENEKEDSVAIEGRSAANRESFRLAQMFSLSEAQRERIFDALSHVELTDSQHRFPSSDAMWAHLDLHLQKKEAALAGLLTPAQVLAYDQQQRAELRRSKEQDAFSIQLAPLSELTVARPPLPNTYTPPAALNQLPDATLQVATPKVNPYVAEGAAGTETRTGGKTIAPSPR